MNYYLITGLALFTLLLAILVTRGLSYYYGKIGIVDYPTDRSAHNVPMSKGGGSGFVLTIGISVLVFWLLALPLPGWELWAALLSIALTGLIEDQKGVPIVLRLAIQVIASIFIVVKTGGFRTLPFPEPLNFNLEWLQYPINLIWIVSVTNFFNFMDGIDGFAGTQSLIAGIMLAIVGATGPVFYTSLIITFASLGFLIWNWQPAKIFMGETGATTLGFLFACIPLYLNAFAPSVGVLLVAIFLWFFLADGAFTLIRRALKGEKVWEAHRSHLYQRLVITGLTHWQVVLSVMGSSVLLSLLTLICLKLELNLWYPLLLGFLLFMGYWQLTIYREKKKQVV